MEDHLPEAEVEEYLCTIPQPGVKAILNNTTQPIKERAKADANHLQVALANALDARPAKLSTIHVTDWKKAQKEDPVLYQVVKNLKAPKRTVPGGLKSLATQEVSEGVPPEEGQFGVEGRTPLPPN